MQGGNTTSVTVVGFAGGATVILFWVLGYFAPMFMMAAPAGVEAACTTVLVGLICYFAPFDGSRGAATPLQGEPDDVA